jgi:hypothetical protein
MSGIARGNIRREEIERENERQAVLNRMNESQMESMAQSRRLAQEDQDFEMAEHERDMITRQATAEALKFVNQDRYNLPPSLNEKLSLEGMEALEASSLRLAQEEAAKLRGQASASLIQKTNLEVESQRVTTAAMELMANPMFWEIYTFAKTEGTSSGSTRGMPAGVPYTKQTEREPGVISEQTRRKAIETAFPDTDPRARSLAMEGLREMALKVQEGDRKGPLGLDEGAKAPMNQVRAYADDAINRLGSVEAALEHAIAKLEGLPEGEDKRVIEQIIADLEGRGESDIDITVGS